MRHRTVRHPGQETRDQEEIRAEAAASMQPGSCGGWRPPSERAASPSAPPHRSPLRASEGWHRREGAGPPGGGGARAGWLLGCGRKQ